MRLEDLLGSVPPIEPPKMRLEDVIGPPPEEEEPSVVQEQTSDSLVYFMRTNDEVLRIEFAPYSDRSSLKVITGVGNPEKWSHIIGWHFGSIMNYVHRKGWILSPEKKK